MSVTPAIEGRVRPRPGVIRIMRPTWTEVGIWAILVLGGFLGAFKRYAPVPQTYVTVAYDALCFAVLAYVILRRLLRHERLPYSPLTLPLLVFAGFAFLTVLNPNLTSFSRGVLGWRFLASGLLFHFLGFYAFDHVQRIWRSLTVFWWTAGVVALYGIVQLVRGYTAVELAWIANLSSAMRIAGTGRYRIMSSMGGALDLGFFLALAFTTLLGALLFRRTRTLPGALLLGLMLVTLIFTFVRAAWVAVFLGAACVILIWLWQVKQLRLLYPSLLITGIVIVLSMPLVLGIVAPSIEDPALQERIGSLSDPLDDLSMQQRFERWNELWAGVEQYPWGLGVGMTGATSLRYDESENPVGTTMDNSYLKVLMETGWPGLLLFLWLFLSVLRGGVRNIRRLSGEFKYLTALLLGSFVTFMVILIFGEYIELNPGRTIVWILTGFLFSLPRLAAVAEDA